MSPKPRSRVAVIYVRVSSARQVAEGASLEMQEARGRAWALANGCEVAAVHADAGVSGTRADNRPGLQAALAQACATGGVFVCYSLSRASRSVRDAAEMSERLRKAGAGFVSLSEGLDTTTPVGRMLYGILSSLGQFEAEIAGERTASVKAHQRARGRFLGGARPRGYRVVEGALVVDAGEAALVARARELRATGLTLRAVAAALLAEGLTPKLLGAESVKRMLDSK